EKRDRSFQNTYYERQINNQSTVQIGDPALYKQHAKVYHQWDVANNEYRQMQAWAVGIMATPVLATTVSPTALVTSLKLKFELNISGALADATVQLA
ncbi:hypothetical protein ABTL55_19100, partial [Acinetobacter baumannii]